MLNFVFNMRNEKKYKHTEIPDWCFANGMEKKILSYSLFGGINIEN